MLDNETTPCWSCAEPVRQGYRFDFYLTGVEQAAMSAPLCYPCFRTAMQIFGKYGEGALRRTWQAPAD